jgi:hypothetical protein
VGRSWIRHCFGINWKDGCIVPTFWGRSTLWRRTLKVLITEVAYRMSDEHSATKPRSSDSSVGTLRCWKAEGFWSSLRQAQGTFLLSKESRETLEPFWPPIQRETGDFYLQVKRSEPVTDLSPVINTRLRMSGTILLLPYMPLWPGQGFKVYVTINLKTEVQLNPVITTSVCTTPRL